MNSSQFDASPEPQGIAHPSEASELRWPISRCAAVGAALGLGWGILARIWMRLISTEPEFTWSGTLAIIIFATWLGMGIGLVYGTRLAARRRWLGLLAIPGILLFTGAGITLFPSFALGSAIWNRAESIVLRWLLAAVGWASVIGPTYFIWNDGRFDEDTLTTLPTLDLAVLTIGYGVMSLSVAYAAWFLWRPVHPAPTRTEPGDDLAEAVPFGHLHPGDRSRPANYREE